MLCKVMVCFIHYNVHNYCTNIALLLLSVYSIRKVSVVLVSEKTEQKEMNKTKKLYVAIDSLESRPQPVT